MTLVLSPWRTAYITNTLHPIRSEEWNQTRTELIHAVRMEYKSCSVHPIRSEEWNQTRIELIHAVHSQLEWNRKAVRLNSHTDSLKGRLHWTISKKMEKPPAALEVVKECTLTTTLRHRWNISDQLYTKRIKRSRC